MPELGEFVVPKQGIPERPANQGQLGTLMALILILLGLLLFYWFLSKSPAAVEKKVAPGVTHVFSIYGVTAKDLLSFPSAVYVHDNGDFYIADTGNDRIVVFDSRGRFKFQISNREKGLKAGDLITPLGVTVDSRGRVYTASFDSGLMVFNAKGKRLEQLPMQGVQLYTAGDLVYMTGPGSIYGFDKDLNIVRHIGTRGRRLGQLETPQDIVITSAGNVVVSDSQNMRIQIFDKNGEVIAYKGVPPKDMDDAERLFGLGTGIAQDDLERIYVADAFAHTIRIFNKDGDDFGEVGSQGDADGLFSYPSDITHVEGNTFAVADKWNDRVQIIRIDVDDAQIPGEEKKAGNEGVPTWAYVIGILILLGLIALFVRRLLVSRSRNNQFQPPAPIL